LLRNTRRKTLRAIYLTDGSQREIKIGKRSIKFKKTVPRSIANQDGLLHLIVQAFIEVGQNKVLKIL
jgi:hypothetical protein